MNPFYAGGSMLVCYVFHLRRIWHFCHKRLMISYNREDLCIFMTLFFYSLDSASNISSTCWWVTQHSSFLSKFLPSSPTNPKWPYVLHCHEHIQTEWAIPHDSVIVEAHICYLKMSRLNFRGLQFSFLSLHSHPGGRSGVKSLILSFVLFLNKFCF